MGGKRSKERRRQERLAARGDFSSDKEIGKDDVMRKSAREIRKGGLQAHGHKKEPKHLAKKPYPAKKPPAKARKEKKFKKPKHLKRKLENASGNEDEKKKILEMMEALEAKKYLKGRKRQRSNNSYVSEGRRNQKNSGTVEGKETEYFHRSNSKQNKEESGFESSAVVSAESDTDSSSSDTNKQMSSELPAAPKEGAISGGSQTEAKENPKRDDSDSDDSSSREQCTEDLNRNESTKSDESGSEGSDSDSDVNVGIPAKRQRGRKRKGREDTERLVQAHAEESEKKLKKELSELAYKEPSTGPKKEKKREERKYDKENDSRRCKGRKPVTDFVVGEKYKGKVVYMKPFGVFIDIMCHSEAFCHVSRLSDGFVKSPEDVLKIGDQVEGRVVDVDREQKRITVSLQSDARIQDEQKSMEAHRRNVERYMNKQRKTEEKVGSSSSTGPEPLVEPPIETKSADTSRLVDTDGNYLKDESEMTQAELKRARKLARRAQRRVEKEED